MKRYTRSIFVIAACGIVALSAAGCGKGGKPFQMPPVSVTLAKAVQMDAPVIINAFGNTEDKASIDIVPQVSGILLKSLIQDGEVVKVDQPLFLIDSGDYEARVKQAEGMIKADRVNFELASLTLERNQPLFEKKLISAETLDTIKAKVASLEAQLQMDGAALDQARLNLKRCSILSPIDGICSKRYVDEGNLVAAGMTRLTNIRSYNPLRVSFSVSEKHLPAIRRAMAEGPVRIEVVPRGDTNFHTGTLEFVDNAVNSMTGTILLRGAVPNPDLKLWANQFVDIRIVAGIVAVAVMVPESAVQYGKNGPYLFAVTADRKADMRLVKTGIRFNDLIQVLSGVTAGETLVTMGHFMLFHGAPVLDLSQKPQAATGAHAPVENTPDKKAEGKAKQETAEKR
jgi:multidrug efflux system membrane fusion protein